MTYKLFVDAGFEEDLNETLRYLRTVLHSQRAAQSLFEKVNDVMNLICQFPTINAISEKPLLAQRGYREQIVGNYIIVYRLDKDTVFVARLFHATQNFGGFPE